MIRLDERIVKILETMLNGDGNYKSVTITFKEGGQYVNTLYVAGDAWGTGEHLLNGWSKERLKDLDSVLSLAQQIKERGSNKVLLESVKKQHAEKCKEQRRIQGELKDMQRNLALLQEAVDKEGAE